MTITIPDFCLVALVGTTGSGKSTFAARHFLKSEIVSSDWARGALADDETDQSATGDAFELVHFMAGKRLERRRLVVVDATNVRPEDRAHLVRIARQHHALAIAIVLDPGEELCEERNRARPDRQFGPHVLRNQTRALKRGLKGLSREGFRAVHRLGSPAEIAAATIIRQPTWTDRRGETGGFDIIGDVHGCGDELEALLAELGYGLEWRRDDPAGPLVITAPEGRRLVFVGDLVDRGPRSPDVLRIAMAAVASGVGFAVPGNHDVKLVRYLDGRNVKMAHGLAETAAQLASQSEDFCKAVRQFLDGLVSHLWLDGGRLVVAHAGIREEMIGRASGAVREFCLYGETTGETDEFGLPIRYNWAADYRGETAVVYGHTPVPAAEWLNNTLCIDTGCCFGGRLTALRWPEREIRSVSSARVYAEPIRPFGAGPSPRRAERPALDDLIDIEDLIGRQRIQTRLGPTVLVGEAQSAAALEAMSRFAVSPRWLVHLPPTMSPPATSERAGFLEHPDEAFDYFEKAGIGALVAEEKHMGSRAIVVICRDEAAAASRFGATGGETGHILTRTGRSFMGDQRLTEMLLERIREAMDAAEIWDRLGSDWAVLDAEIMPWSAKAQALIREQYAPAGAAARLSRGAGSRLLAEALAGNAVTDEAARAEVAALAGRLGDAAVRAAGFAAAYRRYCWPVEDIDDLRVAPFHILASEGAVHMERDHLWHMEEIGRITEVGQPVMAPTRRVEIDLSDSESRARARDWWLELTEAGGEGMVVKPRSFIARNGRGLVQPAVKCRGREYLRLIYGPEYDAPGNLERLRPRGLGFKRSLAVKELVLGHEALARFVDGEPLRRVHQCVFAILALESEPVDPRL
ncbi:MAG: polynucleotide kinase-phosphatase [Hyphomicrobiaceae bacterium]